MNALPTGQSDNKPRRETALRDERLQNLMESCQQEVLRQIIGPFGLTPAMFDDKDGGNVTTLHNFNQGITATDEDGRRYEQLQKNRAGGQDRSAYDAELPGKRKEMFKKGGPITSAYTGRELPKDGRMHLDHVRSAKAIEDDPRANLFMNQKQRVAMANHQANLVPSESSINQSMQDRDKKEWANSPRNKDPGKTNAESFGVDMERLNKTVDTSDAHIQKSLLKAQAVKQGSELAVTGAKDAAKNAVRQAMGVVLYEFVNGSFVEIKYLVKDHSDEGNLIDRLVESLKRVMNRVVNKLQAALEAAVHGGVQGFISNLLTFLINNLITTSRKIVTIIRESMQSLWKAIKLLMSPPKDTSALEVAREVTKIIATVVTTGLGMLMEESVKGFILSVPFLAPIAEVLATALTAIMTGIAAVLVVYGIDRMFDWLSSTGTERLAAQEQHMDSQMLVAGRLATWLKLQYQNSQLYETCAAEYQEVQNSFSLISFGLETAAVEAGESIKARGSMIESLETQIGRNKRLEDALRSL